MSIVEFFLSYYISSIHYFYIDSVFEVFNYDNVISIEFHGVLNYKNSV